MSDEILFLFIHVLHLATDMLAIMLANVVQNVGMFSWALRIKILVYDM
jgi:hypothetical protein